MIQKPVIAAAEAAKLVKDGMTVHVGGFLGCGSPDGVLAALAAQGTKDLTLVCNDTAVLDQKSGRVTGVAPLVAKKQFKRMIVSHIGTNPETQRQMNAGESLVELVPQGTLAERVRAAGSGLGGFLTPTGVGTEVEEGKQKLTVGDRVYLLELPLAGDVALLKAKKADKAGNLVYAKTARNFNPLMATACTTVIAEVEEIVEIGQIDPDQVHTPSIFVDYLVKA
ncbi:MAG TPA: CoA transferase subunit A [Spirochaetales bacterium]|nr:CoA transferase subunit A [Spirochaetales bacterium]HRY54547.1 CoA transferase subunit A [Spirochaetia bacterium]HRZ65873.1 CoA transferase subunit A [Spirochaetia bacterium]